MFIKFSRGWILADNSLSKGYFFFLNSFYFLLCFLLLSRILGFCFYQKRVCFWSSPDFLTNDFFLHKIKESSGSFFCQKKVTKQTLFCMVKVLFVFFSSYVSLMFFFFSIAEPWNFCWSTKKTNFFQLNNRKEEFRFLKQNIVYWGKRLASRLRTGHGLGLVRARVEA